MGSLTTRSGPNTVQAVAKATLVWSSHLQGAKHRAGTWGDKPCGKGVSSLAGTSLIPHGSVPAALARVFNLAALAPAELKAVMAATQVNEVWGVGRRIAAQLKDSGVHTALDLARLDAAIVRRRWSVVLERTVRELQGMACIALEHVLLLKQEQRTPAYTTCLADMPTART